VSGPAGPAGPGVTPGPAPHTIGGVLSLAVPDDRVAGGHARPSLTRRRVVDYCHVATALCPGRARPRLTG
jgi:hypothetical protein